MRVSPDELGKWREDHGYTRDSDGKRRCDLCNLPWPCPGWRLIADLQDARGLLDVMLREAHKFRQRITATSRRLTRMFLRVRRGPLDD